MNAKSESVIVIGGGFAGLSVATLLAERKFHVTLLEGRQVLGGRAYSFVDPQTGDAVDNGQHLFMGCYRETQAFLERIGQLDQLHFQTNLSVPFVSARGRKAQLNCWPLPSPWHLVSGLARLSTLTWKDRWNLRYMFRAIREAPQKMAELDQITVDEWLQRCHQSERARRHLWDLIAIATLNENPTIAAAAPFAAVLSQAFFDGRKNAQLGFAQVGLSELYVHAARDFIKKSGGDVWLRSPVEKLLVRGHRVEGVQLRAGTRLNADWVVSAVPALALLKMLPPSLVDREPVFQRMVHLRSSPIISIHLWFNRPLSRRAFIGLLDTHIQWFFNKSVIYSDPKTGEGYVSVVISGAHTFIDWKENDILAMAIEELRRLLPRAKSAILLRSLVIKEHHATLSPGVGSEALRPEHRSPIERLLLAGDWTRTGLPATIESACVSGHACAEIVSRHCEERNAPPQGESSDEAIPRVRTGDRHVAVAPGGAS